MTVITKYAEKNGKMVKFLKRLLLILMPHCNYASLYNALSQTEVLLQWTHNGVLCVG